MHYWPGRPDLVLPFVSERPASVVVQVHPDEGAEAYDVEPAPPWGGVGLGWWGRQGRCASLRDGCASLDCSGVVRSGSSRVRASCWLARPGEVSPAPPRPCPSAGQGATATTTAARPGRPRPGPGRRRTGRPRPRLGWRCRRRWGRWATGASDGVQVADRAEVSGGLSLDPVLAASFGQGEPAGGAAGDPPIIQKVQGRRFGWGRGRVG